MKLRIPSNRSQNGLNAANLAGLFGKPFDILRPGESTSERARSVSASFFQETQHRQMSTFPVHDCGTFAPPGVRRAASLPAPCPPEVVVPKSPLELHILHNFTWPEAKGAAFDFLADNDSDEPTLRAQLAARIGFKAEDLRLMTSSGPLPTDASIARSLKSGDTVRLVWNSKALPSCSSVSDEEAPVAIAPPA